MFSFFWIIIILIIYFFILNFSCDINMFRYCIYQNNNNNNNNNNNVIYDILYIFKSYNNYIYILSILCDLKKKITTATTTVRIIASATPATAVIAMQPQPRPHPQFKTLSPTEKYVAYIKQISKNLTQNTMSR